MSSVSGTSEAISSGIWFYLQIHGLKWVGFSEEMGSFVYRRTKIPQEHSLYETK
jgi:hypothetical protein